MHNDKNIEKIPLLNSIAKRKGKSTILNSIISIRTI